MNKKNKEAMKTLLQTQRKMYGFDENPMLGKKVIDDPDVAYDEMREDEVEQEMLKR